jgi:hypothetical protein
LGRVRRGARRTQDFRWPVPSGGILNPSSEIYPTSVMREHVCLGSLAELRARMQDCPLYP